jgi:hypothetical protein
MICFITAFFSLLFTEITNNLNYKVITTFSSSFLPKILKQRQRKVKN